jgi:hypothetical protein
MMILNYLDYPALAKLRTVNQHIMQLTSPLKISKAKRIYRKELWKVVEWPSWVLNYQNPYNSGVAIELLISCQDIFLCYECFKWKDLCHFSTKHLSWKRFFGRRGGMKRFCMDCGIAKRWAKGDIFTPSAAWHRKHGIFGTLQHIICTGCKDAKVVTNDSKGCKLCHGCWFGLTEEGWEHGLETFDMWNEDHILFKTVWPVRRAVTNERGEMKSEESWTLQARNLMVLPVSRGIFGQ